MVKWEEALAGFWVEGWLGVREEPWLAMRENVRNEKGETGRKMKGNVQSKKKKCGTDGGEEMNQENERGEKFLTFWVLSSDGKELRDAHKSLNVNEEYLSALRTKSYGEFFTKAQLVVNQPSFPSYCHHDQFSEDLLEPGQETIMAVLDSAILSKIPELKGLMLMYFDISAEASNICSHLLKSINSVQSNYQFIQRALDTYDDYSPEQVKLIISELKAFIILSNPFSNPDKHDFKQINNKYSSALHHLKTMRKKVARKLKLIKYFKKAFGICITAAGGLIAVAAVVLAFHILAALLLGPALFISFPMKRSKKIKMLSFGFLRSGILSKVREQIDVAAKGTYILNRSLDTVSRLVARLHDEVEHKKSMIQFFLERRDDTFSLQVVKEIKKSDVGFRKQVQELEEHVYLCLVTINRARALVVKEMTS
ncbi:UPF0496 protein At1g20180-like [Juglans microcarpa x Juglans regia]|uniref:UPF0496 protein At1g20180-like n=1 Tax=Juglans microcarpa x Juglans regia TaxID=2249226 RepID=UPI001B7F2F8D|nr:UPF0496 protein At1g20180-like [Juglans microcarpa x Juglans regia]